MKSLSRLQVSIHLFIIVLVVAGGAGVTTGAVIQDAGSIEFTEINTKKKGEIVAKGKAQGPKGYSEWASKKAFKIRADPVTFLGNPDPTRQSVHGNGQLIVGVWNAMITAVPAGRYKVVVDITCIDANNANDKKTISKTSPSETVR